VAVNLALNEAALLNYLESLRAVASLPSRVELGYPRLSGTAGGDGQAFTSPFLAKSDSNLGYWRVDGTISTGPVKVKSQDIVAMITAPSATLARLQRDLLIQFGIRVGLEAVGNAEVEGCQYVSGLVVRLGGGPFDCGNTSSTYSDFVARKDSLLGTLTSTLGDLQFNPATNELSIGGSPRVLYSGDLSNHVKATFRDDGATESTVTDLGWQARGTYRLDRGKGHPTLHLETFGLPRWAETFRLLHLRDAVTVKGISLSPRYLTLNVPYRDGAGVLATADGSPWQGEIEATVSYSDGHQDPLASWQVSGLQRDSQTGMVSVAPWTPSGQYEIKATSQVDPGYSARLGVRVNRLWKITVDELPGGVNVKSADTFSLPLNATVHFTDGLTAPGTDSESESGVEWTGYRPVRGGVQASIGSPDVWISQGALFVPPTALAGTIAVVARSRIGSVKSPGRFVSITRDGNLSLEIQ
jgi:hypothetical protein